MDNYTDSKCISVFSSSPALNVALLYSIHKYNKSRKGATQRQRVNADLIQCLLLMSDTTGILGDIHSPQLPYELHPLQSPLTLLPLYSDLWPNCYQLHSDLRRKVKEREERTVVRRQEQRKVERGTIAVYRET